MESFLRNYAIATQGNESPPLYHNWCALSTLGSLASRRIWIDQGHFTVYPSMYVLLVGDPGIKKSTAMNHSKRMIYEFKTQVPMTTSSHTKQDLTQLMGAEDSPCRKAFSIGEGDEKETKQYTHLSIFCDEFVSFLEAGNPIQMIQFLTEAWHNDRVGVGTKSSGKDDIQFPCINILGCMTTQTNTDLVKQKLITSGFSRRVMFVYADKGGEPVPRPVVTDEMREAWDKCIARGKEVLKLKGEFTWTPEAQQIFDPWYITNDQKIRTEDSDVMKFYYTTKPEFVLKVAMLISLSEQDELVMKPEFIELSLAMLGQIEENLEMLFSNVGRNELGPIASAIERMVQTSDVPIPVKRIYAAFYKDATQDEMDKMIEHLANTDKITAFLVPQGQVQVKFVSSNEAFASWKTKKENQQKETGS